MATLTPTRPNDPTSKPKRTKIKQITTLKQKKQIAELQYNRITASLSTVNNSQPSRRRYW